MKAEGARRAARAGNAAGVWVGGRSGRCEGRK